MPQSLHVIALISLALSGLIAGWLVVDLRRRPQHMWIMNLVWPLCALFGSVLVLALYLATGRAPEGGHRHGGHDGAHPDHHPGDKDTPPFAVSVAKGALHCGSGCTLGDIVAEWLAFLLPGVAVAFGWHWLFPDQIFAVWILDFILAFGFGVAFQYFAIRPMRDLSVREGLEQAVKADAASLTSWQVGMYGFMAIAHFWLFPHVIGTELRTDTVEFWLMMQIAMLCGFVTAFPVNWWLIRAGIKEQM
ncbi:MAG: hypothetical protein CML66_03655 [Rhodobacteraceae bacterium]|nr:hypothetical protein [Paracoccaceae bacterium]MAY45323.1 hypothetical protein [Paracoccaceae bacterium]|tara:strand:+ start:133 stop:873 length:741 start_codon:yes stop_codon:yes gene_type:complete